MRKISRIPNFLDRLEKIWVEHPDLRLGQLILNLTIEDDGLDFYNIEDEELIKLLEDFYAQSVCFRGKSS